MLYILQSFYTISALPTHYTSNIRTSKRPINRCRLQCISLKHKWKNDSLISSEPRRYQYVYIDYALLILCTGMLLSPLLISPSSFKGISFLNKKWNCLLVYGFWCGWSMELNSKFNQRFDSLIRFQYHI